MNGLNTVAGATRFGAVVAFIALITWGLVLSGNTVLALFVSILLAIFLDGIAGWSSRLTGIKRNWCLAFFLVGLTGLFAACLVIVWPMLRDQLNQLAEELPAGLKHLEERAKDLRWGRHLLEKMQQEENVQSGGFKILSGLASAVFISATGLVSSVLVVLLGVYLAAAPDAYTKPLLQLWRPQWRPRIGALLNDLGQALRSWLLGRGVAMLAIGVLTAVGLGFLGLKAAPLLGLLAGLLAFIPYIGPLVSVVPALLLVLPSGTADLLYVLAIYGGVQLIEGNLITPLVEQRAVSVPPALILVGQMLMGLWFGWIGVMVSSPLLVVVIVTVQRLYLIEHRDETVQVIGSG